MSVRASASRPSSCSGAMYWNVPRIVPCAVRLGGVVGSIDNPPPATTPRADARPKSRSFAGSRQHHIARLQIAVNDSRAMRAVECVRDLGGDGQAFLQGQRTLDDAVG